MKYRKFGEINWEPSALGFGLMRLPKIKEEYSATIDEEQATEMLHYAFEHGVNYVDTAWPYHGGVSEQFTVKAVNGYQDQVRIATKMPTWKVEEHDDLDYYFKKQLQILQTDHIDFYLLHGLNKKRWETYQEVDVTSWMDNMLAQGKIDYIGFSFHDSLKVFKNIVDAYDWDFCQIQYNFLDQNFQAGSEGLKYAAENDMGVVIMEPLRGGLLAREPPEPVKKLWDETEEDWTPVEWALRWLWDQPEVSLVLSGMSTLEHVKENVKIADQAGINELTGDQLAVMDEVKATYDELYPVKCTGCNYCMPCPNDVAIPYNFELYNFSEVYDQYEKRKESYTKLDDEKKASSCVACGQCEEACPQNLPIIKLLGEVAEYFEDDGE